MTEIVNVFLTESPSQLDAIELAAQEGDCYGLESASHSLKGAVSNFGNTELAADLGRIEILMREGHRDEAFKLARCVRPRLDTFRAELQRQVGAIL
ncbi:MAG: Hpt domain-containing protein [Planctomycetota bacterium]|nr:Hpt domain-containing protein [Planctomycetota bacterium]